MKTVWLVLGQVGQYDDFNEWPVAAFPTEEEAEKYRAAAEEEARRLEAILKRRADEGHPRWWEVPNNPYDIGCLVQLQDHTVYVLMEVSFFDEFVPVVQQDRAQSSEG